MVYLPTCVFSEWKQLLLINFTRTAGRDRDLPWQTRCIHMPSLLHVVISLEAYIAKGYSHRFFFSLMFGLPIMYILNQFPQGFILTSLVALEYAYSFIYKTSVTGSKYLSPDLSSLAAFRFSSFIHLLAGHL